jgi:hypothetical protein
MSIDKKDTIYQLEKLGFINLGESMVNGKIEIVIYGNDIFLSIEGEEPLLFDRLWKLIEYLVKNHSMYLWGK